MYSHGINLSRYGIITNLIISKLSRYTKIISATVLESCEHIIPNQAHLLINIMESSELTTNWKFTLYSANPSKVSFRAYGLNSK